MNLSTEPRNRPVVIGALLAALLWQVYVVLAAAVRVPQFSALFMGLGAELPIITRALFVFYRYWFTVPLIFLVISVDLLRHPERSPRYAGAMVFLAITAGFAMQAWLYEGCLTPLLQIGHAIG